MTILNEIVNYKKSLLKEGYYQQKLEELEYVDVSNKKKLINALKMKKVIGYCRNKV